MKCPICQNNYQKFFIENYDAITKNYYKIFKCHVCFHKNTKVNNNQNINLFYNENYYGKNNKKFKSFFEKFSIIFRYLRIKNFLFIENKKILDIGFGRGIEIGILQKKNETYGVEITSKNFKYLNKIGVKTFLNKKLSLNMFNSEFFDYVFMWHNLEHQKDLNFLIKKIFKILKPNGYLVIEVPNSESTQAKLAKKNWLYWDVPRHINHFSIKSISKLLLKNNFNIKKIKTFSIEYGPFGMLNTIMNFCFKEKNYLYRIILNNKLDNPKNFIYHTIILAGLIMMPFAFFFEVILSLLFKSGSVINITVQKNE